MARMSTRRPLASLALLVVLALDADVVHARPDFTERGPLPVGRTTVSYVKASETTGEPRRLDTLVWYPAAVAGEAGAVVIDAPVAGARWPLIMFSHGSCGLPAQSPFYVETLASWGFVVAAPPHPGNQTTDDSCLGLAPSQVEDSFQNRVQDIRHVLDELLADAEDPGSPFYRRIDPRRIGMSGHSFGGQTTLRVAAVDDRIDGAVALAPAAPPAGTVVRAPAMVIGAELDSLTTFDGAVRRSYAMLKGPRYLVELLDTGHCAFAVACLPSFCGTGCEPGTLTTEQANDLTLYYALPFFLQYVAGNDRFAGDLKPGAEPPFAVVHDAVPRPPSRPRLPRR